MFSIGLGISHYCILSISVYTRIGNAGNVIVERLGFMLMTWLVWEGLGAFHVRKGIVAALETGRSLLLRFAV
jgi:hypothetical protein